MNLWEEVELFILPMVSSGHHPIRLCTSLGEPFVPHPFRFQDIWIFHKAFFPFVRDCWAAPIPIGNSAFSLITKLRNLKARLRDWNRDVFRSVFNEI